MSPSVAGSMTASTSPENSTRSGATSSNWKVAIDGSTCRPCLAGRGGSRRLGCEALGLLDRLLDGADHVEGGLGKVVVLALDQALEALDGVLEGDELAGGAGEDLGDEERLRQEALDLAGARHRHLVLFRELVHAEDGDDVLQRLVALERLLHLPGDRVVLL